MSRQENIVDDREELLLRLASKIGSTAFRHFLNAEGKDVLQGGDLACAFFVSSVLNEQRLISTKHVTIASTLKDMHESGWKETDILEAGNVVEWSADIFNSHGHLGFMVDKGLCVSNSSIERAPSYHSIRLIDDRLPATVYTHPSIAQSPLFEGGFIQNYL